MADSLHQIASRFESRISKALLEVFDKIRDRIVLAEIEEALASGGITKAMAYLDILEAELGSTLLTELKEAVEESGRFLWLIVPASAIHQHFYFSIIDPISSQAIREYGGDLIKHISENTRTAIRNSLYADYVVGNNPRIAAVNFRANLGLTPSQEKAVRNFRRGLMENQKFVLDRALRDRRFDPSILRALANDTPLPMSKIDRMVQRYRERYLKFRAETIARTESLRAANLGFYESLRQGVDGGYIDGSAVRRFWQYTHDSRTRDAHIAIPGMNPHGVGPKEPFKTPLGPLRYPGDPSGALSNIINCRCIVQLKMVDDDMEGYYAIQDQ